MSRFKAALIHLGISLAVFALLLILIVFVWYPQPYFAADGGWQGIRLIAGVDLVLGPLLTLLVFKAGKRGLKRDLTVIGMIQVAALAAGVYLVQDQRTALVVFANGGFYSLNSEQIHRAGPRAVAIMNAGGLGPGYAFVRLPEDQRVLLRQMNDAIKNGRPLQLDGELYEPMGGDNLTAILRHGLDTRALVKNRPDDAARLEAFLQQQGRPAEAFAFLPLLCRYERLLLVLDPVDGKIVDSLSIDPQPLFLFI